MPERLPRVVLYEGAGCHLCHDALGVLEAVRAEHRFELVRVAIDGDPELEARYRPDLPVVEIDGARHAKYHVDPEAFVRALRARGGGGL